MFLPEFEDYVTMYNLIMTGKQLHNLKKKTKRSCQSENETVSSYFTAHFDIWEM